jgi:co-chaperonin GroES (HSP10)
MALEVNIDPKAKIIPLNDYVLIREVSQERVTGSGLIIPDAIDKPTGLGSVYSLPAEYDGPLRAGMLVLFSRYAGQDLTWGQVSFKLIHKRDVTAVVEIPT